MTALLDNVQRLIENGDASTIVHCCSPAGLELAAAILAVDESARRDFCSSAPALAAYLAGLARPQLRAARRALGRPDDPPAAPLNAAGLVHGALAEQRRHPVAAATPAPVAATPTPPARMIRLDDVLVSQCVTPLGHCRTDLVLAGLRANGIAGYVVGGEVAIAEGDASKLQDRAAQRRLTGIALGFVEGGRESHVLRN